METEGKRSPINGMRPLSPRRSGEGYSDSRPIEGMYEYICDDEPKMTQIAEDGTEQQIGSSGSARLARSTNPSMSPEGRLASHSSEDNPFDQPPSTSQQESEAEAQSNSPRFQRVASSLPSIVDETSHQPPSGPQTPNSSGFASNPYSEDENRRDTSSTRAVKHNSSLPSNTTDAELQTPSQSTSFVSDRHELPSASSGRINDHQSNPDQESQDYEDRVARDQARDTVLQNTMPQIATREAGRHDRGQLTFAGPDNSRANRAYQPRPIQPFSGIVEPRSDHEDVQRRRCRTRYHGDRPWHRLGAKPSCIITAVLLFASL
ncbi:hypothetical protein Q7P37_003866 [Cladosporium fusiforme]